MPESAFNLASGKINISLIANLWYKKISLANHLDLNFSNNKNIATIFALGLGPTKGGFICRPMKFTI